MSQWIDLAKHYKKVFVETTPTGDMPPSVLGIRKNEPQALALAPNVDKHLALHAAECFRVGFGSDELLLVLDAHTILQAGKSKEEVKRLYEKYSVPGSMQKACDEEGACAAREIADCLLLHHITEKGVVRLDTYPYDYHGKDGGVEFRWMDEENTSLDERDGPKATGLIPETLREIMKQKNIYQQALDPSSEAHYLARCCPDDEETALRHSSVSMRAILEMQGFVVMEIISGRTPEELANSVADKKDICQRVSRLVKNRP